MFFPQISTSIHPVSAVIYIYTYLLVKEIEAHLECSLIRFQVPVLYTEKTDTEYHIFLGPVSTDGIKNVDKEEIYHSYKKGY